MSSPDRYCWSCGTVVKGSVNAAGSVAASFGSLEASSPPPWMSGEPDEDGFDQFGESAPLTASPGEQAPAGTIDLPEWLRDESDPSSFDFEPPDLDLIGDEDLPAWIPELAKAENGEYDRPPATQQPPVEAPHIRQQPLVPPVSRAWLTRSPRRPASNVAAEPVSLIVSSPAPAVSSEESEPADEIPVALADSASDKTSDTAEPVAAVTSEVSSDAPVATQPPLPEPAANDDAPEIAEAAGPVVTARTDSMVDTPLDQEMAVATASGGANPMERRDRSPRKILVLIVGLLILALIVAAVFVYLFVLS